MIVMAVIISAAEHTQNKNTWVKAALTYPFFEFSICADVSDSFHLNTHKLYFPHFLPNGEKGEENNYVATKTLLLSKVHPSEINSCWIFALTVGI